MSSRTGKMAGLCRKIRPSAQALLVVLCVFPLTSHATPGQAATRAQPPAPCCEIVAINAPARVVTGRDIASQRVFQFSVQNPALLAGLKVGQKIYANFPRRQVSLDGKTACCAITNIMAPPRMGAPPTNARPGAAPRQPGGAQFMPGARLGQMLFQMPRMSVAERPKLTTLVKHNEWDLQHLEAVVEGKPIQLDFFHLRGIDGIQKAEGLPQAVKDALTAHASQLKPCSAPLQSVDRIPQISAFKNLTLDERRLSERITPMPASRNLPPNLAMPSDQAASTATSKSSSLNARMPSVSLAGVRGKLGISPALQAGCSDIPFYVVNKQGAEEWAKTHTPFLRLGPGQQILRPQQPAPVLRQQIRQPQLNPNIPVKRFLQNSLFPNSLFPNSLHSSHFLEAQFPTSISDVENDAQHAWDEAQRQGQNLIDQGKDLVTNPGGTVSAWWEHWKHEATNDWEKIEDCWADHPASFTQSFHPQPDLGFRADLGALKIGQGNVNFHLPLDLNAQVEASVFYIPCMAIAGAVTGMPIGDLPFVVRPRDLAVGEKGPDGQPDPAKGKISYGASVDGDIQYLGYAGDIPIPLYGPTHIPILPPTVVMAGPVPIEFAVYLKLRGRIYVGGEAAIQSQFVASSSKEGPFWFQCDGSGCRGDFSQIRDVSTVKSSAVTQARQGGRLIVEPALWAALQLDLYNGILMARAGPEPRIRADIWGFEGSGCGTSGTTPTSGPGGDSVKALTVDIDANVHLPWEVRFLGTTDPLTGEYPGLSNDVDSRDSGWPAFLSPHGDLVDELHLQWQRHLFFKDFVGSSALGPLIAGSGSAAVGQPAAYRIKMRPCYPYPDNVEYNLKWGDGGGTTTTTSRPAVPPQFAINPAQFGFGTVASTGDGPYCCGSPQQDIVLNHTWSQAGQYTVQVTPVRDSHGRDFTSPPETTALTVDVQKTKAPQGRGGPASPPQTRRLP